MPRQVMASKPSTAQRVGMASEACCSQAGNMNEGTLAPPTITINKVANIAILRATSGVLLKAATSTPKLAVTSAKHRASPAKPGRLEM